MSFSRIAIPAAVLICFSVSSGVYANEREVSGTLAKRIYQDLPEELATIHPGGMKKEVASVECLPPAQGRRFYVCSLETINGKKLKIEDDSADESEAQDLFRDLPQKGRNNARRVEALSCSKSFREKSGSRAGEVYGCRMNF